MSSSGNTKTIPKYEESSRYKLLRIVSRDAKSYCEQELEAYDDLSDVERDFLVAFHDICTEFIVSVLRRSRSSNLEQALMRGSIDLNAVSTYLEISAASIIKSYKQIFFKSNQIDLVRVGIHIVYDKNIKDLICKISFFR